MFAFASSRKYERIARGKRPIGLVTCLLGRLATIMGDSCLCRSDVEAPGTRRFRADMERPRVEPGAIFVPRVNTEEDDRRAVFIALVLDKLGVRESSSESEVLSKSKAVFNSLRFCIHTGHDYRLSISIRERLATKWAVSVKGSRKNDRFCQGVRLTPH